MSTTLDSQRRMVNLDTAEFVPYGLQGSEQSDLTWCNVSYDEAEGGGLLPDPVQARRDLDSPRARRL